MANSRARSSSRSSSSKASRPAARKAKVEVVEENDQGGLDAGLAIITTLLLVAGFFLLDYQLGKHYGDGMFFKEKYEAPQ